jgi:[ribosomal protein S18]-alanine N-acetyltransferase
MDLRGLPYALEPMRLDHVPTISSIERSVFTTPWSEEAFRQEVTFHEAATYLVLCYTDRKVLETRFPRRPWSGREDKSIIGYGGVWLILEQAHVSTLAIRPRWRGKSLGELLFAALIEKAMEAQASTVTLEVRVSNLIAQNLYAKYGLEVVGRRPRYYPDNQEDAWIMCSPPLHDDAYRRAFDGQVQRLIQRLMCLPHGVPGTTG